MSDADHPHVLCCADDVYGMPLGVMVRSLLAHRDGDLSLYVVDAGLSRRTRKRLLRSWPSTVDVTWVRPDFERLGDAPISGHASRANYVRLLIEDLLPADMKRVLYLDVDLLVLDDVQKLWSLPMDGALCVAARDAIIPHIDVTCAPNYNLAKPYVKVPDPIRNYEALGLDGAAIYVNTGVLLIDLARWRREAMGAQLLRCLEENRAWVRMWDQYPLNVVLSGRLKELDPRWNAQIQVYDYPGWRESPYDEATYADIVERPQILHFASPKKPWHHDWPYAHADLFFEYQDQTDWAGWRPRKPRFDLDRHRWVRSLRKRTRRLLARYHRWRD